MKIAAPVLAAACCTLLPVGCGSESSDEVADNQLNAPGSFSVEDYSMSWKWNESSIEITASAPTTGWVSVGFEPTSAMKDADMIIGYVSEGEVFIRDDWGDDYTSHRPDSELGGEDNVTVLDGFEEEGRTEISFSIPLSSGDDYDKVLTAGQEYKVILAYGPDGADNFTGFHAWAETVELVLE